MALQAAAHGALHLPGQLGHLRPAAFEPAAHHVLAVEAAPVGKVQRAFLGPLAAQRLGQLPGGQLGRAANVPGVALGRGAVRQAHGFRTAMLQADAVAALRAAGGNGALKIDAPNGVPLALVVLQGGKVARPVLRLVLVGRCAVIDQPPGPPVGEVVGPGKQGRGLAVPGHADIGQTPIHAGGRQQVGAINRYALGLVNRDCIAVIDGRILGRLHLARFAAVQPNGQAAILGPLDGAKGAVLHA